MRNDNYLQAHDVGLRDPNCPASSEQNSFYLQVGKRVLDVVASLLGLLVASPALLLCAIAIWLDSRGPIWYRQWRVGQQGKPFQILKLRSMVQNADQKGLKLTAAGDTRITRVGRWLRKTKLDEVPQLLNVLRAEMSLVGPRPEVPEYVATYGPEQREVLKFRPGITGPASLTFIDEEEWLAAQPNQKDFYINSILVRKLALDLCYCRQVTFWGDMKLILGTIGALFISTKKSGGASQV